MTGKICIRSKSKNPFYMHATLIESTTKAKTTMTKSETTELAYQYGKPIPKIS